MAFLGLSQKDFLVFLGEAKIADFISWSPISVYPELLMANYIGNFETASAGHLWPFFGGDSYKLYNNFIKKKHDERNWLSKFLKCDTHVPYLFLKKQPMHQSNQSVQSNHSHTLLRTAWYPNSSSSKFTPYKENVTKKPPTRPFVWKLDFSNYFMKFNFWKYFYLNPWKYFDQIKCQKSVKWWFSAKSEILNSLLTAW